MSSDDKKTVTVSLGQDLLKRIERVQEQRRFPSQSHTIRILIEDAVAEELRARAGVAGADSELPYEA